MAEQYLGRRHDGILDSDGMDAGESEILILAEYGLVDADLHGRTTGRWTAAGKKLLKAPD